MNAHRIFTETEEVARTVRNFYNGSVKVMAIFPGLKNNIAHNYSKKQNKIILMSYWNEVKIPETYIPLFKEIDGYEFVMAGNWISQEYKKRFKERLKMEGVIGRVTFLSSFSEKEKISLLQESKFFVRFGSGEKGPGYGTIEAIEAGIPIICNTDLGIAEYLQSYNFALVLEDLNSVDKIKQFLGQMDNEEAYESMQSDIARMIHEYSWQKHASRLLEEIGAIENRGGIENNKR
jgi:glycosyltransferase involved in cell wall biosynthesis